VRKTDFWDVFDEAGNTVVALLFPGLDQERRRYKHKGPLRPLFCSSNFLLTVRYWLLMV
jgi:hypothetical protein